MPIAMAARMSGIVSFMGLLLKDGACAPLGLTYRQGLKNLAMATTFHHQRDKAKGFCH
jgi:hypothetical protein